ncbi:hypothetical protein ZEAMMB73_Zm00001d015711 [Zea mays]|uniref:Uncharacterized protein n=1 Tax=Zea mays TaxID=4577 RepID=A0A1D6H3C6_MAIZE|nr:hypothetical protein ZEAMMB73_Zm00001d015711 [Zea mays]
MGTSSPARAQTQRNALRARSLGDGDAVQGTGAMDARERGARGVELLGYGSGCLLEEEEGEGMERGAAPGAEHAGEQDPDKEWRHGSKEKFLLFLRRRRARLPALVMKWWQDTTWGRSRRTWGNSREQHHGETAFPAAGEVRQGGSHGRPCSCAEKGENARRGFCAKEQRREWSVG